jgi:hypothetical protein
VSGGELALGIVSAVRVSESRSVYSRDKHSFSWSRLSDETICLGLPGALGLPGMRGRAVFSPRNRTESARPASFGLGFLFR